MSNIPLKHCHKCGGDYPATPEFFWKQTHSGDGFYPYCLNCSRKRETSSGIQLTLPIEGITIEIPLNNGGFTKTDGVDGDLSQYKWYAWLGKQRRPYALSNVKTASGKYKQVRMHRMIVERVIGRDLREDEQIDHINNDPLDNRRCNLRICTHSENVKNKPIYKRNKVGLKGVYKRDGKYRAQIQVDGRKIMLGQFDTPEEAHAAYCEAAQKYHGEFARFE